MLRKIAVISGEFARRYKHSTIGVCIICRGILSNSTNGLYEHVQARKMHFSVVYKNALRKELNK